jgi:hypothetical protein
MKIEILSKAGLAIKALILLILMSIFVSDICAQESVFPVGTDINSEYTVSYIDFSVSDTLIISWSVVNNEDFDLANLYIADNIPEEFTVLSSLIQINGAPVSNYYSGPQQNQIYSGCNTYRWAIDLPIQGDSLNNVLTPGDTLYLQYAVICSTEGVYLFPFHTLCCYGDGSGIFTTADTFYVTVSPDSQIGGGSISAPRRPELSFAYPNPSNSEVIIKFAGEVHSGSTVSLKIFDSLGREIHKDDIRGTPGDNYFRWRPQKNVASGIYFYNIYYNKASYRGTITLLR